MSRRQTADLAVPLEAINQFFNPIYGPNTPEHFNGMDVEFKLIYNAANTPELVIKQARPYPGGGRTVN